MRGRPLCLSREVGCDPGEKLDFEGKVKDLTVGSTGPLVLPGQVETNAAAGAEGVNQRQCGGHVFRLELTAVGDQRESALPDRRDLSN